MDPKRKTIKELLQLYKLTGILPWKAGRRIDMEEAYKERMKDVARENYAAWGYASPEEAWQDQVNNPTYDYRGYYSDPEFQNANSDAQSHWPDRYKTPAHRTFSDESKYHGVSSDKNPYGLRGGMWIGDNFKSAAWQSHLSIPEYHDGKDGKQNSTYAPNAAYGLASDGYTLPEVTVIGRKLPKRGGIITTGGAGYIPSYDAAPMAEKIANIWNYITTYVKNKINGDGGGEVIDLSNKNVARIKSNTKNVNSILTNEFVEHNDNTVRLKKDFVDTKDTLLGDRKIPLSKISTFYGIEDGKLKAGPLEIFDDSTTVVPNRAKYVGKVREYHPAEPTTKEYKDALDNAMKEYNSKHGYKPSFLQRIFNYGIPFISDPYPWGVLSHNVGRKKALEIANDLGLKFEHLGPGKPSYMVTEGNDTVWGYNLNASPKALFADESGNAVFVSLPRYHVDELNKYLNVNPMYPIMVDNGRYSAYQTMLPNAEIYGGFNRPNDMFILGTVGTPNNSAQLPEYAPGKDDEQQTDAIQSRQMIPLEVQEDPLNMLRTADRLAEVRAKNLTYIGPATHTPQQLLDYYRDRDETARFMARKKAVELATDEMMLSLIDPRYVAAGWAVGKGAQWLSSAWKAAKTLTKNYRLARAIKKAVKNTKIEPVKEVPGQVGWAPKTTVEGYHASDAPDLEPDFWFDGWALKRGNAPGFYIAGGEAPEEGFLAKRQHLYDAEATFDKPMVQIGERKAPEGNKNISRGLLERTVRDMGADGIIYLDIADNQMTHQHIAHVLHPDVNVKVTKRSPKNVQYGEYEAVNDAENTFDITTATRRRGRPVRQPYANTLEVLPVNPFQENKQSLLMPSVGADAYVDSKGNVNLRNVVQMVRLIYKNNPDARPYKNIINSSGNLYEHIRDVVLSAQKAPIPKGFTRLLLVLAALFHDIGKVIDSSYSGHAQASLDLMKLLGIDAPEAVKRAIKVHMRGSDPNNLRKAGSIGEESPLAQALHFVDVVRNKTSMTNDEYGAFSLYRNLLYPAAEDYKIKQQYSWDTDYQLKNIINPILNAYGYKEIELGLPPQEARRQLLLKILLHRRFIRGQHGLGDRSDIGNLDNLRHATEQFQKREGRLPTTEDLYLLGLEYFKERNTQSGTRGAEAYMHKMELPWKHYMSLYTSNSSEVPMSYRRSSSNPLAISALEMPVQDNPEWSLAELWGYNDYPLVYSRGYGTLDRRDFNSLWRSKILPYILDNGTGGKYIATKQQINEHNYEVDRASKARQMALNKLRGVQLKPIMPSDVEPSDFMEAYYYANLFGGHILGNHFRPAPPSITAVPFPAQAPFPPASLNNISTKSLLNAGKKPKKDYYGSYRTSAASVSLPSLEDATESINRTLLMLGIKTRIIPRSYSRLSDKVTVLKYPRALKNLYDGLYNVELYANIDIPSHIPIRRNIKTNEALPAESQYRGMTVKLIEAHNNANKVKYIDGVPVNIPYFDPETGEAIAVNTKYIPSAKQMAQKLLNRYFKDVKLAKSKDAFVRRAVANYRNLTLHDYYLNKLAEEIKETLPSYEDYVKQFFVTPEEYQHAYPFPLWSRDGYKVFITEHDEGVGSNSVLNYIFVGKRGSKALKANTKFNFEDTGERYDHGRDRIGGIYRGLTRNEK